ncbi:hypothetical protein Rhopal_006364-T1 [Rhodotorula paludigena]|uniref:Uncharacterized protein n=1 Tax=Rhodotorula paludigena TaxID=86838 RepID=A0AAV5GV06_9BASI|nr:hypothetical protein Rhopal_006364-T1 [Rhodotorula paludigena]
MPHAHAHAHARAHAPLQPSRLALSSSSPLRPAPSSDSALPSSPTTTSFYLAPPPGRAYKSQSSSRRLALPPPPASSSSPSSLRARAAHESARLSRAHARTLARARAGTDADALPDAPGGWTAHGEWEEYDAHELAQLEVEVRRERRRWEWERRLAADEAGDEGRFVLPDEVDQLVDDDTGQEPPLDVLYDDLDPSLSLPSPLHVPRLPSLTSAASSSSSEPEDGEGEDSAMSTGADAADAHLASASSARAFELALLAAPCPACGASGGSIRASAAAAAPGSQAGARCAQCGWGIAAGVLHPLIAAFAAHGDVERGHAPVFSYTPFTGTLVFCAGCDEQYAA